MNHLFGFQVAPFLHFFVDFIDDALKLIRGAAFDLDEFREAFDLCLRLRELLFILFCVLFIDGLFELCGDEHLFQGCRVFVLDAEAFYSGTGELLYRVV
ncbi:MAG: hypothetical protein L6Q53_06065 [Candidatus Brocadia sinica]|nr:hypothetical protein [Candidatus Brocadia sinica]